jgi:nucleoside-diphosphate-sugar epimerase
MNLAGTSIAVTGASGFIGGYLVRALIARGARVIAVVRRPELCAALASQGAELRRADLADRATMARAFRGAEAAIANAGLISLGGHSRRALVSANVEGTRNVFHALADAGVGRALFTSSAVVYRPRADHRYREDDPLRRHDDPATPLGYYAISKAWAEHEAWQLAHELGIVLSTARPHTVYGAFDNRGFTRWFKLLMRAPIAAFPTQLMLPSVYAGDLAEAMCRMLERTVAHGRAYNISGEPDRFDYWDLFCAYREAGGRVPRVVLPMPVPLRRSFVIARAERDLDFENRAPVDAFRDMLALERANGAPLA